MKNYDGHEDYLVAVGDKIYNANCRLHPSKHIAPDASSQNLFPAEQIKNQSATDSKITDFVSIIENRTCKAERRSIEKCSA